MVRVSRRGHGEGERDPRLVQRHERQHALRVVRLVAQRACHAVPPTRTRTQTTQLYSLQMQTYKAFILKLYRDSTGLTA